MKGMDPDRQIAECVSETAKAHCRCSFLREEELQWFLSCQIRVKFRTRVEREAPSQHAYITDDDGKLVSASYPVPGRRRSHGRIDIRMPRISEDIPEGAAIEVKFPRGSHQDTYLQGNLRRDLQKLSDEELCTKKYLFAFMTLEHRPTFVNSMRLHGVTNLTRGITWCGLFFNEGLIDSVDAEPTSFREILASLLKREGILTDSPVRKV